MTSLVSRLRSGPPVIAAFSVIPAPAIVEMLATAGFDAVILDTEHGPMGPESLNVLVPAARAAGIAPLIRVRENSAPLIGAALDVGAAGVVVPQVDSAEGAAAAVRAARFAPLGARGANPYVRSAGYYGAREYFATANDEVALIVMIEGVRGLAALPAILDTPGIDAIFVGPFDLSQALGHPGETEHPQVVSRISQLVAEAGRAGIATGVFAPTPVAARRWLGLGVRFVAIGFDSAMALEGFRGARRGAE